MSCGKLKWMTKVSSFLSSVITDFEVGRAALKASAMEERWSCAVFFGVTPQEFRSYLH